MKNKHIHIKYSNDNKTFTDNDGEERGLYVGMYIDEHEYGSLNFNDYIWKPMIYKRG